MRRKPVAISIRRLLRASDAAIGEYKNQLLLVTMAVTYKPQIFILRLAGSLARWEGILPRWHWRVFEVQGGGEGEKHFLNQLALEFSFFVSFFGVRRNIQMTFNSPFLASAPAAKYEQYVRTKTFPSFFYLEDRRGGSFDRGTNCKFWQALLLPPLPPFPPN